jgi:hypothetical protein
VTTTTLTIVPGLTATLNVPANSEVYVSTDGGLAPSAGTNGISSVVDIVLTVDGVVVANGAFQRVIATNTAVTNGPTTTIVGFRYWSMAQSVGLAAGTHTIAVAAALAPAGGTAFSANPATVSGNNSSVLQGQSNILIIKK